MRVRFGDAMAFQSLRDRDLCRANARVPNVGCCTPTQAEARSAVERAPRYCRAVRSSSVGHLGPATCPFDAAGRRDLIDATSRGGRRTRPPRYSRIMRFSHQQSAPARRVRWASLVKAEASRWQLRLRLLGAGPATWHSAPPLAHGPDLQRCLLWPSAYG